MDAQSGFFLSLKINHDIPSLKQLSHAELNSSICGEYISLYVVFLICVHNQDPAVHNQDLKLMSNQKTEFGCYHDLIFCFIMILGKVM